MNSIYDELLNASMSVETKYRGYAPHAILACTVGFDRFESDGSNVSIQLKNGYNVYGKKIERDSGGMGRKEFRFSDFQITDLEDKTVLDLGTVPAELAIATIMTFMTFPTAGKHYDDELNIDFVPEDEEYESPWSSSKKEDD